MITYFIISAVELLIGVMLGYHYGYKESLRRTAIILGQGNIHIGSGVLNMQMDQYARKLKGEQ